MSAVVKMAEIRDNALDGSAVIKDNITLYYNNDTHIYSVFTGSDETHDNVLISSTDADLVVHVYNSIKFGNDTVNATDAINQNTSTHHTNSTSSTVHSNSINGATSGATGLSSSSSSSGSSSQGTPSSSGSSDSGSSSSTVADTGDGYLTNYYDSNGGNIGYNYVSYNDKQSEGSGGIL